MTLKPKPILLHNITTSMNDKDQKNIISRSGYEKIVGEINDIKTNHLPETIEVLKDARAQWDLSENSDYHAAKEKIALLERRVVELEWMIENVEIVDDDSVTWSKWVIKYWSIVTVEIEDEKSFTFEIVWTWEVDVTTVPLKLSFESAVVSAVQDKKKWDVVVAKLPHGRKNVHILDVK